MNADEGRGAKERVRPDRGTGVGSAIETGALLAIIEQSATIVLTLVEGLERDELLRSRLTRVEVLAQLMRIAECAATLHDEVRAALPEIDWDGWRLMHPQHGAPRGVALDDTLWFACEAQLPATLLWLRFYRHHRPDLFRMVP
jgi:uncharacterized protein with HEPN domain